MEMNKLTIGIVALALASGSAAVSLRAQAGNHAAIEQQIVANERAVNDAFAKNDTKTFHNYVAADSFGVDAMGVSKVADMDKMMPQMKVTSWNIDGSQFYWVNDSTVVHTYRWTGKGSFQGQPLPSPVWASSVWTNRGGKWVGVFHQETAAMLMPPAGAKK
jgi:hypothetical protein